MTDQELLEAYKEAKKKQWSSVSDNFSEFARKVNKTKELEEQIVVRWVKMIEEKKSD